MIEFKKDAIITTNRSMKELDRENKIQCPVLYKINSTIIKEDKSRMIV